MKTMNDDQTKVKLPTYMNDNAISMDVFQVILDTLKVVPESLDQIKEFVDGI